MKFLVFAAILAVVTAAPTKPIEKEVAEPVPIVSASTSEMNPDGSYSFVFDNGNGIITVRRSGSGKHVVPKPDDVGIVSRGSYSYTAPDGITLTVNWIAR